MVKRRADRKWKLSSLFWRYLVTTGVMVAVCTVLWWMAVVACISVGFVYQASVGARNLQKTQERLLRQEEFQGEEIPFYYDWCLVSEDGTVLQAKMSEKVLKQAKNVEGDDGMHIFPYSKFFHAMSLKDGSRCVLAYDYSMPYVNPMLQRYLPDFQVTAILLLLVCWGVIAVTRTRKYTKILQNDTRAVRVAADLVASQRLDEPILLKGKIRELNDALETIEKLRVELATSLSRQWAMEEQRNQELASLSHDLKTPITAVKGYVEGIMDGVADTPEKMDRYVRTIYNKTNEMDHLINELTFYSKIDTNRIPYTFSKLNVEDYFSDCAEELGLEMETRGIELVYANYVEKGVQVIADGEQIRRVIHNIVSNAIKYMEKPKGIIQLRVKDVGDFIQVEIEDNGKGIAAKDLPYIFDRFYRTDVSRNSSKGGSGIGLSIVKKIMEDHGGKVWATSRLGIGTIMYFVLRKYQENILSDQNC